jgi:hypothetical protein
MAGKSAKRPRKSRPWRSSDDVRIQCKHPDQYVAFIESGKKTARGVVRKIVAVADSLAELQARIVTLPGTMQRKVCIEYMLDPEGPIPSAGQFIAT